MPDSGRDKSFEEETLNGRRAEKSILNYKFEVIYRFRTSTMMYEPLLVIFFLFGAFLLYIGCGRVILTIQRDEERKKDAEREKELHRLSKVVDLLSEIFDEYDALLRERKTTIHSASLSCLYRIWCNDNEQYHYHAPKANGIMPEIGVSFPTPIRHVAD